MKKTAIGLMILVVMALLGSGCKTQDKKSQEDPTRASPGKRVQYPDTQRLDRVDRLGHVGALNALMDILVSKQLVASIDEAQRGCAPLTDKAQRFEKRQDSLTASLNRKEISREQRDRQGTEAVETFFKEILEFPIPQSLAGKACLYEAVLGLFRYGDTSDQHLEACHKKAQAIAAALKPDERAALEINPAWHDLALQDIKDARLRRY